MKLGDILEFRKDLYFEGAVQADWFYDSKKATKVAENFVFHGKEYFGTDADDFSSRRRIDTISFVERLAEKFQDETSNPLTLAIADYGTGKSHLAVTLGEIFSGKDYAPATYRKVIKNISGIDEVAGSSISSLCNARSLVIVLNGMRDFNLHFELLRAAQKSLQLYGLPIDCLKSLNRSINTANLFFNLNKKNSVKLFEEAANKIGWSETGESLLARIDSELGSNKDAFSIVNDVYTIVNGQEIQWDEGISASVILEMLIDKFCGLSGIFERVVILFDEFGRYLEYASSVSAGESGDSALQQIFEVAQNAEGKLQVINFIQSDIKAYLQRVDQTKNISRYIGRYDASDKYYLSSNLETVFANLIQRKDETAFKSNIILWQDNNENAWKSIFEQINKWLPTKGLWQSYEKFRKIIVEGIYPLHPLSTFMLTQLSDYLQNRSSLTLISQSIAKVSEVDIDVHKAFLILPEQLLNGDLYAELLAAEQQGRQPSQQCIKFDNIYRKFNGKLSVKDLMVLRANLIMRILRFKTTDYEEAKSALRICSGLTVEEVNEALKNLEHQYAILAFDDHAGCFDFIEDSRGAYDFQIILKRKFAEISSVQLYKKILNDVKIREIAGLVECQTTNFSIEKKISTNEWVFKQELYCIEDFTVTVADELIKNWENAINSTTPKGTLVWLYLNKDSSDNCIDKITKIAAKFKDKPIFLMLLNDIDDKLEGTLVKYYVLLNLEPETKSQYRKYFDDELNQVTNTLVDEFADLKKQRQRVSDNGVVILKERMAVSLTNILKQVYPHAIPFCFDSFITKNNNISAKATSIYCTILKMLLSNNVSYDYIHNLSNETRIRIDALLMVKSVGSWQCINDQCQII